MSKNNLLFLWKSGFSNVLDMTYINDINDNDKQPLELTSLYNYVKSIYSKNGEDFQAYTLNIGKKLGSDIFNKILKNKKLCEEYNYEDLKKQEEENNQGKDIKEVKVSEKDKNGKALKDANGKIIYKEEKETVEKPIFIKILYKEFSIYYKGDIEIKCAKLGGLGLNPTTFAKKLIEEKILSDEEDQHIIFKPFNPTPKIKVKATKPRETKEKDNKNTKKVDIKGGNKNKKADDAEDKKTTKASTTKSTTQKARTTKATTPKTTKATPQKNTEKEESDEEVEDDEVVEEEVEEVVEEEVEDEDYDEAQI